MKGDRITGTAIKVGPFDITTLRRGCNCTGRFLLIPVVSSPAVHCCRVYHGVSLAVYGTGGSG